MATDTVLVPIETVLEYIGVFLLFVVAKFKTLWQSKLRIVAGLLITIVGSVFLIAFLDAFSELLFTDVTEIVISILFVAGFLGYVGSFLRVIVRFISSGD
jgi:hypothetical protein